MIRSASLWIKRNSTSVPPFLRDLLSVSCRVFAVMDGALSHGRLTLDFSTLLPGKSVDVRFIYASETVGMFLDAYVVETVPALKQSVSIHLKVNRLLIATDKFSFFDVKRNGRLLFALSLYFFAMSSFVA